MISYFPCIPLCKLGTSPHRGTGGDELTARELLCRLKLAGFHNLRTRNLHFQCTETKISLNEFEISVEIVFSFISYIFSFLMKEN